MRASTSARSLPFLLASLALAGCESKSIWQRTLAADAIVARIEAAHGAAAWRAEEALELQVSYAFADVDYRARVLIETNREPGRGRTRLETGDVTLVFDGDEVWQSPANASFPSPGFHARIYAELVGLPFALGRAEQLELRGKRVFEDRRLALIATRFPPPAAAGRAALLGDAPFLFVDPETERIDAVAFRMPLHEDTDYGNAVTFEDLVTLDGVPIPTYMQGYRWSEETSIRPGHIAAIAITGQSFVHPGPDAFEPPRGAVRVDG